MNDSSDYKKIAVFPGSFDPFTKGHENIVRRGLELFDKIIIAIGVNSRKSYMFPLEKRLSWIQDVFQSEDRVDVSSFEGLTVDYCKNVGANFILRGIRNSRDFDFEYEISTLNRSLNNNIETVFLASLPEFAAINSTIVREIVRNNGNYTPFLPDNIKL